MRKWAVLAFFVSVVVLASGEVLSPNMGLPVPTVGLTEGPQWATDINSSLSIIDAHNHTPGSGVQIPPSGLDINADLSFGGNNATSMNSVAFQTNVGTPSTLSIYSNGTDLFYKDSSGSAVQMTLNHGVNVSAGNIQNLPSAPSGGAGISWLNSQGTFQMLQDSGSVGANIDGGSLILRYTGSYPTPSGNYVAIEPPSSLASGYALTLPSLPAQTNVLTLGTSGQISSITYDAVGQGMTSTGANAVAASRTRSTGSTVSAGGVAISSSCGNFGTSSTTPVAVTNLSVTITTSGRPVQMMLVPDGTTSDSNVTKSSLETSLNVRFYRDGSPISNSSVTQNASSSTTGWPVGSFSYLDPVSSGTYTYTVRLNGNSGGSVSMAFAKLIAYEL